MFDFILMKRQLGSRLVTIDKTCIGNKIRESCFTRRGLGKFPGCLRNLGPGVAFLFLHWRREQLLVVWVSLCMIVATAADLLMPVYSGKLVDAVAMHATARSLALQGAGRAIAMMALLGVVLAVQRYIALAGIIRLTLRLMTRFAGEAFWRVQRFSTDLQANNFAGAIVRRITRGMWAVDTIDDIRLLEMLPALLVLVGSSILLGLRWPGMGVTVAIGAVANTAAAVSLSL